MAGPEALMTQQEAIEAAAAELARDADLVGAPLAIERVIETPGFWALQANAEAALASGLSADSLIHRLPPIVVDRTSGRVTRLFAAGARFAVRDLGPEEWEVVSPPASASVHDDLDGLHLDVADLARIRQLAHFRVRRAGRDDGDRLEASLAATSPAVLDDGMAGAGLHATDAFWWSFGGGERIIASLDRTSAVIHFRISQNRGEGSWTISAADLDVAERVEQAFADAAWVRFWF